MGDERILEPERGLWTPRLEVVRHRLKMPLFNPPGGGGGGGGASFNYASNHWYGPPIMLNLTTLAPGGAGQGWAIPYLVTKTTNFKAVGFWTSATGGAGSVTRVGVWNDNNGVPGTLKADWGTIDTVTATGSHQVTFASTQFVAGPYWLALIPQVATSQPTFYGCAFDAGTSGVDYSVSNALVAPVYNFATLITGALADNPNYNVPGQSFLPLIRLQAA